MWMYRYLTQATPVIITVIKYFNNLKKPKQEKDTILILPDYLAWSKSSLRSSAVYAWNVNISLVSTYGIAIL